jgi:peptidoglycan/xylan/chitin deacetylase (PgdA/CDA1 family)
VGARYLYMLKKIALSAATIFASFALLFPAVTHAETKSFGDIDNNGMVNIIDLSILMSNYGTTNSVADVNSDGAVNIFDLSTVLSNFGKNFASTKLDGNNLGSPVTAAPYSISWNTALVANGSHTLSALATNTSGFSTAAANIVVNVQNTVTPPVSTNLITNPSVETAQDVNTPQSWSATSWGTNTPVFSYLNTGHTGAHSIKVEATSYTNGAANWFYSPVAITSGKTYKYENWYQSNVDTEVDAEVQMSDGTTQYFWLGTVLANPNWTKYTTTFTVPAGAKNVAIYHVLAKKGFIVSDDYSLSEYTSTPFTRGLVSVTFDDGWVNQYTNAFPSLTQNNIPATFYIISGELANQPDYMTATQVKNLQVAGHEIASHSVTHSDLTTVSAAQLQNEFAGSQTTLQNVVGVPVVNFAYPFGAYNSNTINVGKLNYRSQRTVNAGLNTKDGFDITQLKIYEVDSNISQAQVQGWVNAAIAQKAWLILVYHEIAVTPLDPTDALYTTQPTDLNAELTYIKNSGATTLTVNQALNEVLPQL